MPAYDMNANAVLYVWSPDGGFPPRSGELGSLIKRAIEMPKSDLYKIEIEIESAGAPVFLEWHEIQRLSQSLATS